MFSLDMARRLSRADARAANGHNHLMRVLIAGATGFVGGRLARELLAADVEVRALVRDPAKAGDLKAAGAELHQGDVLDRASLDGAADGVDVAYYLVHGMGRGSGSDFRERERRAARNFAATCREAEAGRVIYLGGLGDNPGSEHLRSRHETGEIL